MHEKVQPDQSSQSSSLQSNDEQSGTFMPPVPFQLMANGDETVQLSKGKKTEDIAEPVGGDSVYGPVTTEAVRQGGINDCYLMSTLASLASNEEGRTFITDAVEHIGDGRFKVKLYAPRLDGSVRRMNYTVPGGMAEGAKKSAGWVKAIETAYALHYNGQGKMGGEEGGSQIGGSSRVMKHITGQHASAQKVNDKTSENTWARMGYTLSTNGFVTARTPKGVEHSFDIPGVYGNHSYAVLSVDGEGDKRTVTLYNPWGYRYKKKDQKEGQEEAGAKEGDKSWNKGTFTIPYAKFEDVFVEIAYNVPWEDAKFKERPQGPDESEEGEKASGQDRWTALRQQYNEHTRTGGGVSTELLGKLIRMAVENATFPASIPKVVQDRYLTFRPIDDQNDRIAATTEARRIYMDPDVKDVWKWIRFSATQAVGDTLSYATEMVEHELAHAADLHALLPAYYASEAKEGASTGPDGETPTPEAIPTAAGAEKFLSFTQSSHATTHERHTEIYAEMNDKGQSKDWSSKERVTWIYAAMQELPRDVGPDESLPIEASIMSVFAQLNDEDRSKVWKDVVRGSMDYDESHEDAGMVRTWANHFDGIWNYAKEDKVLANRVREMWRTEPGGK